MFGINSDFRHRTKRALLPVREHEHVVLDEDVFHAFQELWTAAHIHLSSGCRIGTHSIKDAMEKLEAAGNLVNADNQRDPRHHLKVRRQIGLPE